VQVPKARKPAADAARGLTDFVHLGQLNDFEATNPILSDFQAAQVARRFGLTPNLAASIARCAFGEVRSLAIDRNGARLPTRTGAFAEVLKSPRAREIGGPR
jgi:hypothetical protein